MFSSFLILAAVLAQSNDVPFVILTNEDKIFAFGDESDFDKDIFVVREDKPWAMSVPQRSVFKRDVKGYYRPGAAELEAYYAQGWKANGGIRIDTSDGPMWVFEEEYNLAKRAAEMAEANEAEWRAALIQESPTRDRAQSSLPDDAPRPFGQLWGAHVAVLTLGLGLSGLVVWFLILE